MEVILLNYMHVPYRSHENEIKRKYILSHEYKSMVDDAAKEQKEKECKQQ